MTSLALYFLLLVLTVASSQYASEYRNQETRPDNPRSLVQDDGFSRISYKFQSGATSNDYGPPVIKKFEIRPSPNFNYFSQDQEPYSSNNDQEYQPPRNALNLFTPSHQPYPAHTTGQVKSMQDYLQEERRDVEREQRQGDMRRGREQSQSHVSYSGPNQAYSYQIKY